ncbi:MAG: YncE family protein [Pseudonocardiaceae bacterium]
MIDTTTNTVIATIPVGNDPTLMAVAPNGSRVYVANSNSDTVSVIDTATNTVIATIRVGKIEVASGVAVAPNGRYVYVSNLDLATGTVGVLSVIDTVTNTLVTATPAGPKTGFVAVTTRNVYVTNVGSNTVSVIDT